MKIHRYPYDPSKTSVAVAADWVANNSRDGAVCPCCNQLAKVYRRKLHSTMAYALLLMHRAVPPGGDMHVPRLLNGHGSVARGGDFAKLAYWDLIKATPGEMGFYSVTEKGRQFAECRIAVPEAVYIYNGERLDWDTMRMVTIVDALGVKFNYEELMAEESRA